VSKLSLKELNYIADKTLCGVRGHLGLKEIGLKEDFLQVKFGTPLDELEKKYILFTLEKTRNKAKTAKILGIGRKTLYNKLEKYGIEL
jgi:DNA-binding NtrC family response regulator